MAVAAGFALLVGAAVLASHLALPAPVARVHLQWWLVAALFALTQAAPLNLQIGRETRSVSLTELPFVLGLLFVSAPAFVVARCLGGIAVELVVRRQYRQPTKLAFNAVLFTGEAVLGTALFRLIDNGQPLHTPWALAAAAGAVIGVSVPAALAVALVIELVEGRRPTLRGQARVLHDAVAHAVAIAVLGLNAALAILYSEWAFVPLFVAVVTLFLVYRGHAALTERHERLEQVYRFTRDIGADGDTDDLVHTLLTQVEAILHAESARLTVLDAAGAATDYEFAHDSNGRTERVAGGWLTATDGWILDHVVRQRQSLIVARDTRDVAARGWLERNGLREAMLVPLRLGTDIDAILIVSDRLGEARGFDASDVRMLETLATQAAVELRNQRLVEQLRYESLHDPVTGAPNRVNLESTLVRRLESGDAQFALGMIGLDAVQEVNDSFGHHRGDELLVEVARRLVVAVAGRGQAYRFGGAEFAVVLDSCASMETATAFFQRVVAVLADAVVLDDTAIDIGARAGVAVAPEHATAYDELLKCADIAMYAAKGSGDEVAVYDPTTDTSSRERLALAAALRQAIAADQLTICVQPKADLKTGAVVSAEALVRWYDAERGNVPPVDFIPLAEQTGLIRPLTELVLDKALAACADWQSFAPAVGIAVNISARLLHLGELEQQVDRLLRRHGVPASLLTLEITETSLMGDPIATRRVLTRLRDRGVAVSVDDFGTGYSSLSHLRRLPVHELKVDQSFVQGMGHNADDAAIVRAIVDLAHTLDLLVVAEGVEDAKTWEALVTAGADVAQGYYLAKPMPIEDFSIWFESRAQQVGEPGRVVPFGATAQRRRGA
jgi:diguanylate cyclase (GGDEF)-like protein